MDIVSIELLDALLTMSTQTRKELAERVGLKAQNISNAMSGDRSIPKAKLADLLVELGLTEQGHLREDNVCLWKLGPKVAPLRIAAAALFPRGADYAGLWRAGAAQIDLVRTFDVPLIGVTDGHGRVLVRSEGYGLLSAPQPVNRTTIPNLRKRLVNPKTGSRMLEIPSKRFRFWERGEISTTEFDRLLSAAVPEKR